MSEQNVQVTQALEPDRYDAGLLGGSHNMSVDWWHDYIRSELERAHEHYVMQFEAIATRHRTRAEPDLVEVLDDLQQAEAEYRLMHDRHGDGSRAAGRAWDLMRRAGDKARAALTSAGGEVE